MNTPRIFSDAMLEQYLLGELDHALTNEIDTCLTKDEALQKRLDALQADNERFLEEFPPRVMAAAIKQRARQAKAPQRAAFLIPGLAGAGATLALLLVVLVGYPMIASKLPSDAVQTENNGIVYYKGLSPQLHVYQKQGGEATHLDDGQVVKHGTVLQLGYLAAGKAYGVVMSLDGRGTVTEHWPERGNQAALLQKEGEVRLPFSYQLDDAPRFERFYLVVSDKTFSKEIVRDALQKMARQPQAQSSAELSLPEGLSLASFLVMKTAD